MTIYGAAVAVAIARIPVAGLGIYMAIRLRDGFMTAYAVFLVAMAWRWGSVLDQVALWRDVWFAVGMSLLHIGLLFLVRSSILKRRRTLDNLRESEQRYRRTLESVPAAVFVVDRAGRLTYRGPLVDAVFPGAPPDATVGDLLGDAGTAPTIGSEEGVSSLELTLGSGQATRTLLVDAKSLPGDDGARLFICRDVTELRRQQVELEEALGRVRQLTEQLEAENLYLKEEIRLNHNFEEIIGRSPPLLDALGLVEQVAGTGTTVLITGETGTGKELFARAIHDLSPRRGRPLVKVNCAALPATLIESELFGHERGAFTGAAARRPGRFELANGGTIFLDEVGELPIELQPKLLRVLQEGEFERLGGTRTLRTDVRVIAATNRDLREACERGRFREDLFYRLNVFPIHVPALRDRRGDVGLLVHYFLRRFARRLGKSFDEVDAASLRRLEGHDWPGNVRELQNVVERAAVTARDGTVRFGATSESASPGGAPGGIRAARANGFRTLEQLERDHISEVLRATGWTVQGDGGAAEVLGLNPSTLRSRMKKLGIVRPD